MTATQPMTGDELIDWLATNLAQFNPDYTITPLTLTALHPGLGHLRAKNALHALHSAGLLHSTSRTAVYALRADLPTSGNGHVWLRLTNRAHAPVEVIGKRPRCLTDNRDADHEYVRWTCHGCTHGQASAWFVNAAKHVEKHAGECLGEALGS
uniref:hypothetical protein n=1 Tax=Streptomyces tubercidicus TaxID=47759 RepID=UPI0037DCD2FF|nr:hypothetical protein OG690_37790 [Streptomyces tubercidicus]